MTVHNTTEQQSPTVTAVRVWIGIDQHRDHTAGRRAWSDEDHELIVEDEHHDTIASYSAHGWLSFELLTEEAASAWAMPEQPVPARRSPDGYVAQRMPEAGAEGRTWMLTNLVDNRLNLQMLHDHEVAGWPLLLDSQRAGDAIEPSAPDTD